MNAIKMHQMCRRHVVLALCAVAWTGCSKQTSDPPSPKIDGTPFLLTAEPARATGVIQVRDEAADQDEVVVVGRIGGSENPWVAGLAAFSIVDPSIKSCLECGSDGCLKPWDYC